MKKARINRMMKKWYGRLICRVLGEEKGAVAMEYIVIALLVAAAVVALVMVFGGNLRNMFDKTNQTLNQSTVAGVKEVGEKNRDEQKLLEAQNDTAVEAGNKLGGDFQGDRQKATGGTTGGGKK